MTSKSSFSKLLFMNMKGRIWGFALSCLSFFMAFTVYGAMSASSIVNKIALGVFSPENASGIFTRNVLGERNVPVMIFVVIMAIFTAFNGFSYLFSKSKVDMYHSTPIKREEMFAANYAAGVITYIIPYVFFMISGVMIGGIYGMLSLSGFKAAIIMLFINFLGFIGIYNIAIIAIMLTGNLGVSILATCTLMFYGLVMELICEAYKSTYFLTYTNIDSGEFWNRLSPLYGYISQISRMDSYNNKFEISVGGLLLFIAYCIVSAVAGVFIYKYRASESAGKSIAFNKIIPYISIFLLVAAALVGGIAFESIASEGMGISYGWYIFGFVLAMLLGHCIIQVIYYQDYKAILKNPISTGISCIIAAVVAAAFMFDLTGYDRFIPKDDAYVSAGIASYGMQGYEEYYDFNGAMDMYGGRNIWVDLEKYRLDHMQFTDKSLMRDLQAAALEDTRAQHRWFIESQFDETIDYSKAPSYTQITVRYNMKNGRKISRRYNIDWASHMDLYNRLYNEEYKEGVFSILSLNDEDIDNIEFVNGLGVEFDKFEARQMHKLVEAYRADLLEQTADSLKNEIPYGYICRKVAVKERGYTSYYSADRGYVYPNFKRTLAILEDNGIDVMSAFNIDNVENVTVNNYTYSIDGEEEQDMDASPELISDMVMDAKMAVAYGETEGKQKIYTDRKDIEAILSVAVPSDLAYVESGLCTLADLDITVTYLEAPMGYSRNYAFAIEKDKVPGFVADDVKYEN